MTRVTTATRRSEIRRAEILRAAVTEFGEAGYANTATESIANRAGISQAYLFKVFGSKKKLMLASLDANSAHNCIVLSEAADQLRAPDGTLDIRALGVEYGRRLSEIPGMAGLLFDGHILSLTDDEFAGAVRAGNLRVMRHLRAITGLSHRETLIFYSIGMTINLFSIVGITDIIENESWSEPELYAPADSSDAPPADTAPETT